MSLWLSPMLAIVLLASPTAAAAPAKKKPRAPASPSAALVALDGLASATDKSTMDMELRSLLPGTGHLVQPKAKTEETLATVKKLGLACDSGDVDCLIRVGALGGVSVVLKGILSVEGEAFALDLVAVDIKGLRERGRVRVAVPRTGGQRRTALDSALTGVLRPDDWRGQLRVGVAQRGASVVVDGVPRGFAPLSGPLELTPGRHVVFVVLEGFRTHKETIDVVYEGEVGVDVTLVPGVSEEAPMFTTATTTPAPPSTTVTTVDASPGRRRPMRVVMYDVEATGVPPRVAQVMGAFLVAELRKREGISVLDSSELRALVGDGTTTAGDVRGCTQDQCFAEVAEALGADGVVVAQLTQLEDEVLFGLRRIDQQKQEVTGSFLERVPVDDAAALLPLVGTSIAATFGDVALRPGQTAGVDERAGHVMNPPPLPPLLSGSLYAGTAVAGGVGVTLLGVSLVSFLEYDGNKARFASANDADENSRLQPIQDRFYLSQVAGFVGVGAAVILGTAAVVTGLSTDWDGYGAAGTTASTSPPGQTP